MGFYVVVSNRPKGHSARLDSKDRLLQNHFISCKCLYITKFHFNFANLSTFSMKNVMRIEVCALNANEALNVS